VCPGPQQSLQLKKDKKTELTAEKEQKTPTKTLNRLLISVGENFLVTG
jgi:hypothetical protein